MRCKKSIILLFTVIILLFPAGCSDTGEKVKSSSETPAERTVFAMDTIMNLQVYGSDAGKAADAAVQEIQELEQLLSVTRDTSEIYAVNHSNGAPVTLSESTAVLLDEALSFCKATGGVLDISVYPLVKAWGFTTGEYRIPDPDELRTLLTKVDYSKISFDQETGNASLPAEMEIDLGCIAKGYTGDRIIQILRGFGAPSAIINLGGNVQTLGSKPDGSAWRIAVKDPKGDGYVGILESRDEAVITSGGYERYFEQDGKVYWHIIDPATGAPANSGIISATIISPSGTRCDALSTALFIMGQEKAADYWRAHGDFEYILILEDGSVVVSEGLSGSFTLTGDWADHSLITVEK